MLGDYIFYIVWCTFCVTLKTIIYGECESISDLLLQIFQTFCGKFVFYSSLIILLIFYLFLPDFELSIRFYFDCKFPSLKSLEGPVAPCTQMKDRQDWTFENNKSCHAFRIELSVRLITVCRVTRHENIVKLLPDFKYLKKGK